MEADLAPVPYAASVLTSEVYNEAEVVFTMLQNKEKLISFLDCTTVLRAMGMNPTSVDMDWLKERMAEPVLLLEQWRREEELKREKERRKEEARERRGNVRTSSKASTKGGSKAGGKAAADVVAEAEAGKPPVKIVPVEEIKNIDWNIFINCVEEMYRDAATEQKEVLESLRAFNTGGPAAAPSATAEADGGGAADDMDALMADAGDGSHAAWVATPNRMTVDELLWILTTNGDNVLTPAEVKQLQVALPAGGNPIPFGELAARLQGTYRPPTQADLDRAAAAELEAMRRREEAEAAERAKGDDLLAGL